MAHPKSSPKVELERSNALPRSIAESGSFSEFLSSCKSKFTAKGYKTALSKFFNFAAVEKPGFTPDVAFKQKPKELNPLVQKYAMQLKQFANTTEDFRHGEVSVNSVAEQGHYANQTLMSVVF